LNYFGKIKIFYRKIKILYVFFRVNKTKEEPVTNFLTGSGTQTRIVKVPDPDLKIVRLQIKDGKKLLLYYYYLV
jgi:hypothetical protein